MTRGSIADILNCNEKMTTKLLSPKYQQFKEQVMIFCLDKSSDHYIFLPLTRYLVLWTIFWSTSSNHFLANISFKTFIHLNSMTVIFRSRSSFLRYQTNFGNKREVQIMKVNKNYSSFH